jgi:hypothetical protein
MIKILELYKLIQLLKNNSLQIIKVINILNVGIYDIVKKQLPVYPEPT